MGSEIGIEIRVWKERVSTLPRGPVDVNVSENHVWSVLLHKNIFSTENCGENASKSSLPCTYSGEEGHVIWERFKNAASREKTDITVAFFFYAFYCAHYRWWRRLFWRPRELTFKIAKLVYNSTWITLIKHGFVPVKTWLLIACGWFYAMIMVSEWLSLSQVNFQMWNRAMNLCVIVGNPTYFHFWWQNWVHYSTHAYIIPWYVAKHVWVDAKSVIASESQK